MEFKCKNCSSTKYRQISISVKQCEECGMQIKSEGTVDPKVLDVTEELDNNVKKYGKIDFSVNSEFLSDFLKVGKRITPDGTIEYSIDGVWI